MCVDLMPLKISGGWAVCYNRFFDVEPELNGDGELVNWGYFTEDVLQLARMELVDGHWRLLPEHLLLDLGWYPDGEAEGAYRLELLVQPGWETVLEFSSPDRNEIRDALEALLASESLVHPNLHKSQPFEAAKEAERFLRKLAEEGFVDVE